MKTGAKKYGRFIQGDSIYGNMDWDLDGDGMMTLTGSHFFTTESPEMRRLRQIFQEEGDYEHGEYYIFIMQQANATGEPNPEFAVMGDMPRGQHFGFVFMNAVRQDQMARLIAHEVGHGIFTLRHTFDSNYGGVSSKRRTDNLMDYGDGTELAAFQWNVMSNPAWITRFDSEEEGRISEFQRGTAADRDLATRRVIEALRFGYAFRVPVTIDNLISSNWSSSSITLGDGNRYEGDGISGGVTVVFPQGSSFPVNPRGSWTEQVRQQRTRFGLNPIIDPIRHTPEGYAIEIATRTEEQHRKLMSYIRSANDENSWRGHIDHLLVTSSCSYRLHNLSALPDEALRELTNTQRELLLLRIADNLIEEGSGFYQLAARVMKHTPESDINDMFDRLSNTNILGLFSRHLTVDQHYSFVRASMIAFFLQERELQNEEVIIWRTGLWCGNVNLSTDNNSLIIDRMVLGWKRIDPCLQSDRGIVSYVQARHNVSVNMTDLIGLTIRTRLGSFEIGRTYFIPAFYFDWLVRNHQREQDIRAINTAVTIGSFAIGAGKLTTAVRAGRLVLALRVGNMVIATGDLALLNQRIEDTMRDTGFLGYWNAISIISNAGSLNASIPNNLFYGVATAFGTYRNYLRVRLGPQLYELLIELIDEKKTMIDYEGK